MTTLQGSFGATGRLFDTNPDFVIRGGEKKEGILVLDIGGATTVTVEVSQDEGLTWITEATYNTDQVTHYKFPSDKILYTLNCTVYAASTPYTLSDGRD